MPIYSQTPVQHDFWCKVKSHVVVSFMFNGDWLYFKKENWWLVKTDVSLQKLTFPYKNWCPFEMQVVWSPVVRGFDCNFLIKWWLFKSDFSLPNCYINLNIDINSPPDPSSEWQEVTRVSLPSAGRQGLPLIIQIVLLTVGQVFFADIFISRIAKNWYLQTCIFHELRPKSLIVQNGSLTFFSSHLLNLES